MTSNSYVTYQIDSTQTNEVYYYQEDTMLQDFSSYSVKLFDNCDSEIVLYAVKNKDKKPAEIVVYAESRVEGLYFAGVDVTDSIYVVEQQDSSWQGKNYYFYYYDHPDSGGSFYKTQTMRVAKYMSYGEIIGDGEMMVYEKIKVLTYQFGYVKENLSSAQGGIISDDEHHHYDIKTGEFQFDQAGYLGMKYYTREGVKFGYVHFLIHALPGIPDPKIRIKVMDWAIQK